MKKFSGKLIKKLYFQWKMASAMDDEAEIDDTISELGGDAETRF